MTNRITLIALSVSLAIAAEGSWWWPFGGGDEPEKPRVSDLVEPASLLIDDAADLRNDGKYDEAVAKYREALAELDRVEAENPERAATSEFAMVRNKRGYVTAAIDAIFIEQAKINAKAVVMTDTSELQRKFAEERARKEAERKIPRKASPSRGETAVLENGGAGEPDAASQSLKAAKAALAKDPSNRKARMVVAADSFARKDYQAALEGVDAILSSRPNDAAALNLKGLVQMAQGDAEQAEATFTQLVKSNPSRYFGYYNLARATLKLRGDEGKPLARQLYYDHGRGYCGGPVDKALEEALR